jgi:hypothetical protein
MMKLKKIYKWAVYGPILILSLLLLVTEFEGFVSIFLKVDYMIMSELYNILIGNFTYLQKFLFDIFITIVSGIALINLMIVISSVNFLEPHLDFFKLFTLI